MSIYREQDREFSVGDRVQLTVPSLELKLANRELGTVESIGESRMALKMDSSRSVEIDPAKHPHLDHGYAVTSHSSQGQTADRVLINVDTEVGAKDLLNNRMPMSPSRVERTMRSSLRTAARAWERRWGMTFRTRVPMCPS